MLCAYDSILFLKSLSFGTITMDIPYSNRKKGDSLPSSMSSLISTNLGSSSCALFIPSNMIGWIVKFAKHPVIISISILFIFFCNTR